MGWDISKKMEAFHLVKRKWVAVSLVFALLFTVSWLATAAEETGGVDFIIHVIPELLEWTDDWENLLPNIFFIAEYRLEVESAGEEKPISYGFRLDRFEVAGQPKLELYSGHFSSSSAYPNNVQRFQLVISAAEDIPEATVQGKLENERTVQSSRTMPQEFTAHLQRVLAHDRLKAPLTVTRAGAHYAVAYWAVPVSLVYSNNIDLAEGYTAEELVEALRAQDFGTIYVLSIVPN